MEAASTDGCIGFEGGVLPRFQRDSFRPLGEPFHGTLLEWFEGSYFIEMPYLKTTLGLTSTCTKLGEGGFLRRLALKRKRSYLHTGTTC